MYQLMDKVTLVVIVIVEGIVTLEAVIVDIKQVVAMEAAAMDMEILEVQVQHIKVHPFLL
jgi:hypothetical protein